MTRSQTVRSGQESKRIAYTPLDFFSSRTRVLFEPGEELWYSRCVGTAHERMRISIRRIAIRRMEIRRRDEVATHILLVDDDALLRRSLSFNLEHAGYRASAASSAEDALMLAVRDPPQLILLDIGLPGMDGLDALRHFRARVSAPIIFLTARRRELDEVLGLELGADDYVTKPFDLDVLLARIKAVLRRSEAYPHAPSTSLAPLVVGDLVLDPAAHTVTLAGRPIELPPREFDLLHALALTPGQVISVDALLDRIWGVGYEGEPQVVYVHVRWLREKLEKDPHSPRRIITVRGVGYKLEPVNGNPKEA
jgi:DNA-binding response OmpR family regulator